MKTKKYLVLTLGILIGMISMLGINVYANISNQVTAFLANYITFEFDGEAKPLPEGYAVLLYEGRSYVPARFVAEELGADVEWDIRTQTIKITKPEEELPPEIITPPAEEKPSKEREKEEPKKAYTELPMTHYDGSIRLRLQSIVMDDNVTRLYVSLHNYENTPVQLEQTATVITIDGKEYKQIDAGKRIPDPFIMDWYQDIRYDETTDALVRMPPIPKDTKELTVKFEVRENTIHNPKTLEVEFDVKL